MQTATIEVAAQARLSHREAMGLAEVEFARMISLLRALDPEDWARPTVCELWDVRTMASHVLGMAETQASVRQFAHDYRAAARRSGGKMIDAMTATQVDERTLLTPGPIIDGLTAVAPKAVRARRRTPAPMRWAVRHEAGPTVRSRAVALRLSRRHRLHPRHLDAPPRHQPGHRPTHGTHRRPRRPPRRRCRRRLGRPPRPGLHPHPHRPGRGHLGTRARAASRSSSTPWTSAGPSGRASPATDSWPPRFRSDDHHPRSAQPGPATAARWLTVRVNRTNR